MTAEPGVAESGALAVAPRTRARKIIGLDGARGLSCLGVAISHIGTNYSPHTAAAGKVALFGLSLVFFYVLSGFLLFLPYLRALVSDLASVRMPSTRNFAVHRIARIVPGYLAIFLICNFVFQIVYVDNPAVQRMGTEDGTGVITDPLQLLANLTLIQSYIPAYFQTGLNTSWSLSLEYAFYVSLPLFGLLLFALRKRTTARPLMLAAIAPLAMIVIGFVAKLFAPLLIRRYHLTNQWVIDFGPNWAAVFLRSFLANADNFAFGMLAAMVIVAIEASMLAEHVGRRVRLYSALGLIPAIIVLVALHPMRSQFESSAVAVVSGLLILIMVAPLACGQSSIVAQSLDVAPIRFVGKVSLSAYLWHFPIMLLFGRWGLMAGDSVPGLMLNVTGVLTVTLLVSAVTYYCVERPATNFAKRFPYRVA
jgi:peptidoglycan/LPS O-acetylase OafA/YrhL